MEELFMVMKDKTVVDVVSYRRVSTPQQVLEGEGLEIQDDRILEFCQKRGFTRHEDGDFKDEGVSGAKESIARPGIVKMLDFCKENRDVIKYVVIDKVDRLSRELMHLMFIEKELTVLGIEILYSSQEALNGNDPTIKLMRQIIGAFAEFERELINQRLSDGIRKKTTKGDKASGRQPFGYEYDRNTKMTVINKAEAQIIERIFYYRLIGSSLSNIASLLNVAYSDDEQRKSFSKSNQNRKWSKQSIQAILANDYYLGIITYNDKKIKGNHEPIIDIHTWSKINGNQPEILKMCGYTTIGDMIANQT